MHDVLLRVQTGKKLRDNGINADLTAVWLLLMDKVNNSESRFCHLRETVIRYHFADVTLLRLVHCISPCC